MVKEAQMAASWCPPLKSMAKVNADAALFGELGVGVGMGTVLRDHEGVVLWAAASQLKCMWDVDIVEAKAILLGLKMALQSGVRSIVMESDNLKIINKLKAKEKDGSYLGIIL